MSGHKIKDVIAGNFARVTIDGQSWVREPAWQPIETAPHQQTVILGLVGSPLRVTAYRKFNKAVWRHVHSSDYICFEPTHWRELPEPPNGDKP